MDKLMQTVKVKLQTERYIADLPEDIDDILNENNDSEDFNIVIDDDEWGNDF